LEAFIMKHSFVVRSLAWPVAIGVSLLSIAWTDTALAQGPSPLAQPDAETATEASGLESHSPNAPDRPLLGAGIFLLATSYLPATAVAGASDRQADQRLFIPVAGPWLDLAQRGPCVLGCGSEMAYRSLIVTDGILQGLGAFMTLVGLLADDDPADLATAATNRDRPLRVSPAIGAGSYGLTAFGSF
jgi:hypothetical protein